MSVLPDGTCRCDGPCGGNDVGNGAVFTAAVIVDLNPERPGEMRQGHLCRQPSDAAPNGCAALLLTSGNLPGWIT